MLLRILVLALSLLAWASPAIAAITWFGVASTPADNGTSTSTTITLTPPASMTAGDLVLVHVHQRGASTFTVGVDGGQTWNTLARQTRSTVQASGAFWARFDGTWSANPRFDFTVGTNTNVQMLVFRPSDTAKLWAVDATATETTTTFSAGTTPFTKTITGKTLTGASAVMIATWATADNNTWGSLSGAGWSQTGLSAQYRNTSGSDTSETYAYFIGTGASGNVSQNEATLGGDAGISRIIGFYEYDAPTRRVIVPE